jgi:cell pole-organizing protein PopZ
MGREADVAPELAPGHAFLRETAHVRGAEMSKSESAGTKSLEEILVSIRKSLADEAHAGSPEPKVAAAPAAQPQPPGPGVAASAPAKGNGVLSDKLASIFKEPIDADLSELLAAEPKKPDPAPVGDPQPGGGSGEKDPLWFLSRVSSPAPSEGSQGPAARARDAAKAPPAEDVALSRPETLRSSLPPLFGETVPTPPAVQEKPAVLPGAALRTEPRFFPGLDDDVPGKGSAEAETASGTLNGLEPAGGQAAPDAEPAIGPQPVPSAEAGLQAPMQGPEREPQEAAAAPGAAGPEADAPVVGGAQSRALEQMVAELLEPVIRQWLQSNLPRLIESTVREEVKRVVAAEREAKNG